MAKVKAAALAVATRTASNSKMAKGKAGLRTRTRLIGIYAPPKVGKTTAVAKLKNAKWVISDSNCLPTLAAMGALPHPDDTYEVQSLAEARIITADALKIAEAGGAEALGCDAMVFDSLTQFRDWHMEDVAAQTGQRWLGDNQKNNGWQQLNTEMGRLVDDMVRLSRYIHVIFICHAAVKPDGDKGKWAGLSLNPAIAEKVGRSTNWLLFMTSRDLTEAEALEFGADDPFIQVLEGRAGKKSYVERALHTIPYGGVWHAAANASKLRPEEPPDLQAMLEKEGLL